MAIKFHQEPRYNQGGIITHQFASELDALIDTYRAMRPKRILEIGADRGGTIFHWIANAVDDAIIVAVDDQITEEKVTGWKRWALNKSDKIKLEAIKGDSHRAATVESIKNVSQWYDFVFIDGDHSYPSTTCDLLLYGAMIRPGGLLVMHEILGTSGSAQVWSELFEQGNKMRQLVSYRGQRWNGIGLLYVE